MSSSGSASGACGSPDVPPPEGHRRRLNRTSTARAAPRGRAARRRGWTRPQLPAAARPASRKRRWRCRRSSSRTWTDESILPYHKKNLTESAVRSFLRESRTPNCNSSAQSWMRELPPKPRRLHVAVFVEPALSLPNVTLQPRSTRRLHRQLFQLRCHSRCRAGGRCCAPHVSGLRASATHSSREIPCERGRRDLSLVTLSQPSCLFWPKAPGGAAGGGRVPTCRCRCPKFQFPDRKNSRGALSSAPSARGVLVARGPGWLGV